jgi:hypothetical protein
MSFFRAMAGWLFALSCVVCAWFAFRLVPLALHSRYASHPVVRAESLTIFPIEATIFGVAWWSVWKRKPSAKFWGIAGSLTWILTWLIAYLQFSRFHWVFLACGIAGMVAFLWRAEKDATVGKAAGPVKGGDD